MDKKGFILSWRYTSDSWLFEKGGTSYIGAWDILVKLANHKDSMVTFNNKKYMVRRGQKITSYNNLSIAFKWSIKATRTFLKEAEKQGWIKKETIGKDATLITLVNYNKEQDGAQLNPP